MNEIVVAESPRTKRTRLQSIDYELFRHDILPSSRRPSTLGKVEEGKMGAAESSITLEIDAGNSVGWVCPSIPEKPASLVADITCSSFIPPESDGGDKKQQRIEKLQK